LVAKTPGLGAPVAGHSVLRRWPLRRFPFYMIFRVDAEAVVVLAVGHERRRPEYWGGRS
jgi:hypothetical protein